ncbi:MAG: hypothetical protein OXF28_03075 [Thaumarchaeota archaeon]|nr:hypothetical protein [Nitrososphaerota archaeon]
MLTKRTIIGIIVGITISTIGLYALISSLGLQTAEIYEKVKIGDYITYEFNAPEGTYEIIYVKGSLFHVNLESEHETKLSNDFQNDLKLDWNTGTNNMNMLSIKNIGDSELEIMGTLKFSTNPVLYTYHILVIIAGVVIIGFSASFSIKRKKLR